MVSHWYWIRKELRHDAYFLLTVRLACRWREANHSNTKKNLLSLEILVFINTIVWSFHYTECKLLASSPETNAGVAFVVHSEFENTPKLTGYGGHLKYFKPDWMQRLGEPRSIYADVGLKIWQTDGELFYKTDSIRSPPSESSNCEVFSSFNARKRLKIVVTIIFLPNHRLFSCQTRRNYKQKREWRCWHDHKEDYFTGARFEQSLWTQNILHKKKYLREYEQDIGRAILYDFCVWVGMTALMRWHLSVHRIYNCCYKNHRNRYDLTKSSK